jgi:hypothetical protein
VWGSIVCTFGPFLLIFTFPRSGFVSKFPDFPQGFPTPGPRIADCPCYGFLSFRGVIRLKPSVITISLAPALPYTLYFFNNEPSKNKHFLILLSSLARNSQEPKLKRIFEIL